MPNNPRGAKYQDVNKHVALMGLRVGEARDELLKGRSGSCLYFKFLHFVSHESIALF